MSTVVITGGNRGIGLELAKIYRERNDEVYIICRTETDEAKEIGAQVISGIDVTDEKSIALAVAQIPNEKIDILINNAGVFLNETLGDMNLETIEKQFQVNTLAPLKVTMSFLSKLKSGSKLLMMSSRMGSLEDNTSGSYYGYRMSKAGLNAFTRSLAVDLKGKGISVGILHPGYVKTRMTDFHGEITPEEAACGLTKVIDGLDLENSGSFWHSNGQKLPW
ncbi:KR domain protein [Bacteriovorax sp. BSW11_IV]|uniref:SDR family oxidoreductase n=1 Tax=Bacteriovorax sp. BSW11_IV TaxID=1353529 RepID=UPI00038A4B72|nr:SDR family oxidoreductase [Bacteriovorax sp. BSW11_IV]EQC49148.1 KR domain protein [Bacteriovorax sp. BSW11_IV]